MRFFKVRFAAGSVLALVLCLAVVAQSGGAGRGFDVSRMDKTASACQDFYQFSNGNWLKTTEIPPAFSSWGSFNILAENNRNTLREILDAAAKTTDAKKGSVEQKIGDFYASCTDEAKREAEGVKPLLPEFARIEKIKSAAELQAQVARMHSMGVNALFDFEALPDFKNSSVVMGIATQGGLSLPTNEYYTKTDEKSVDIRNKFVQHVTNMFQLLGDAPEKAAANAKTVLAIQTRLAENSRDPVALRDISKQYNKMTAKELQALTPNLSWGDYFAALGQPRDLTINLAHPEFYQNVNKMLTEVPIEDWKTYLRWHLISAAAPSLSSKFEDESFNFNGKVLAGRKEQNPRWRRCVAATDAQLGEALGQAYVARAFTPESKRRMQTMINNLIAAFRERVQKLDWMSDPTRKEALAKLAAFQQKIGYPDKWIDYSALEISRASFVENALRAGQFEVRREMAKIGKPVDRGEWGMTPPTVNAYNNWLMNEIVFPAGILQAPFFNPEADDAINYGAIGAVIGHEITHGFDDQGANFDLQGNLKDWWTPDDKKKFQERAECIVNQFGAYEVEPGLKMTGKLVSGESIADLGGLQVAYDAFLKSLEGKPRPKDIDGFTPEQRFFMGWAQVWASKYTPEITRLITQSDPHPISRFRVNGPLSNMPEFAAAFQCKAGDPMVRPEKDRCKIW
ncbi:MAG TPA: M13 family metallopeptidase [Pyrinomonadaceae bacterium]